MTSLMDILLLAYITKRLISFKAHKVNIKLSETDDKKGFLHQKRELENALTFHTYNSTYAAPLKFGSRPPSTGRFSPN